MFHHVGPRCPATLNPIDGGPNWSPLGSGSWRGRVPSGEKRSPSLVTAAWTRVPRAHRSRPGHVIEPHRLLRRSRVIASRIDYMAVRRM